ncbi:hypothetical protein V9T40_014199 [Parthenolecanium corni]|uniref:Spondin-1 n=1 Tax=Parthenolecanium corni TaxID=536013 RepID=A0AAN9TE32_9HEMI
MSCYWLVQGRDECDKFFLTIEKEPEYFVPKSAYIVGIESNNVNTFSTFGLTAEAVGENGGFGQTGWFSLMFDDRETQFSSDEINTIEQKSTSPKQSIHVLWTAPISSKQNCVLFNHSRNMTMWTEGQYATEGLRQIAEFGSRSIMESELLEKKKHLRSLIKMAGLWYPRMNLNTSTTFRVDKRRNLISLAAMLGPSPDWFTGISNLNLCTKDCSWIENKVLDLGLYDAGTDSGISYMSPNAPTLPQERVYRITSRYPEDPRAPFYSMEGEEMKPIGRLYLHRNQITQKSCIDESNMFDSDHSDESEKDRRESIDEDALLLSDENCKTSGWSEWSECTATCGIGFMTRTRRFLKASGYKKCKHVSVFESKKCMEPPCKTTTVEQENANCTTSPWSDWSPCTATCGKGLRIRIRHLIVGRELKEFCQKKVVLEERRECNRTADCIINETEAKGI